MMDDKRDFAEAIMLLEGIFGTEFPLDAETSPLPVTLWIGSKRTSEVGGQTQRLDRY